MAATDSYRVEHAELISLVREISTAAGSLKTDDDSKSVCTLLSKLSGKISMHLAKEDNALYPRMLKSGNEKAAALASSFQSEMGGIADAYKQFAQEWTTPSKISAAADKFVEEFGKIAKALGDRIERENRELYPAADAI